MIGKMLFVSGYDSPKVKIIQITLKRVLCTSGDIIKMVSDEKLTDEDFIIVS